MSDEGNFSDANDDGNDNPDPNDPDAWFYYELDEIGISVAFKEKVQAKMESVEIQDAVRNVFAAEGFFGLQEALSVREIVNMSSLFEDCVGELARRSYEKMAVPEDVCSEIADGVSVANAKDILDVVDRRGLDVESSFEILWILFSSNAKFDSVLLKCIPALLQVALKDAGLPEAISEDVASQVIDTNAQAVYSIVENHGTGLDAVFLVCQMLERDGSFENNLPDLLSTGLKRLGMPDEENQKVVARLKELTKTEDDESEDDQPDKAKDVLHLVADRGLEIAVAFEIGQILQLNDTFQSCLPQFVFHGLLKLGTEHKLASKISSEVRGMNSEVIATVVQSRGVGLDAALVISEILQLESDVQSCMPTLLRRSLMKLGMPRFLAQEVVEKYTPENFGAILNVVKSKGCSIEAVLHVGKILSTEESMEACMPRLLLYGLRNIGIPLPMVRTLIGEVTLENEKKIQTIILKSGLNIETALSIRHLLHCEKSVDYTTFLSHISVRSLLQLGLPRRIADKFQERINVDNSGSIRQLLRTKGTSLQALIAIGQELQVDKHLIRSVPQLVVRGLFRLNIPLATAHSVGEQISQDNLKAVIGVLRSKGIGFQSVLEIGELLKLGSVLDTCMQHLVFSDLLSVGISRAMSHHAVGYVTAKNAAAMHALSNTCEYSIKFTLEAGRILEHEDVFDRDMALLLQMNFMQFCVPEDVAKAIANKVTLANASGIRAQVVQHGVTTAAVMGILKLLHVDDDHALAVTKALVHHAILRHNYKEQTAKFISSCLTHSNNWMGKEFLEGNMDKAALKRLVTLISASDGVPIIGAEDDAVFLIKLNEVLEPATDIAQSGAKVLRSMIEDYEKAVPLNGDLFTDAPLIGPAKKFLKKIMALSQGQQASKGQKTMEQTMHLERTVGRVQEIVEKNPSLAPSFSHTVDFIIGAVAHSHAELHALSGDGAILAYKNSKRSPQTIELLGTVIQKLTRTIDVTVGFRLKAEHIAQRSETKVPTKVRA